MDFRSLALPAAASYFVACATAASIALEAVLPYKRQRHTTHALWQSPTAASAHQEYDDDGLTTYFSNLSILAPVASLEAARPPLFYYFSSTSNVL